MGIVVDSKAMNHASAWEKRVRRQISSKEYSFLAVVQAAFRDTCSRELRNEKFAIRDETDGGLEFTGRLEEGWRANLVLRTPSRIYCRAAFFKAGAREELFRRVSAIPWELWISASVPLRIEGRAIRSRIHHEGVLASTFYDALERRFHDAGLTPPLPARRGTTEQVQRILVRSEDDRCVVSLDMSGTPLYSRGYREKTSGAPLRETLAAALIAELGYRGEGILLDPMTGSGTIAVEAGLVAALAHPGRARPFLFESWPSFRRPAWDYLRRPADSPRTGPLVFASDIDAEALAGARRNGSRAGMDAWVRWEKADFFTLTTDHVLSGLGGEKNGPRFLIINPPYGIRIPGGDPMFYQKMGKHIEESFAGWKTLVLFPNPEALKAFGLSPQKSFEFRHGGLRVIAGIFR
jgi:23S rRNA G2445 N2-methylase RlmL